MDWLGGTIEQGWPLALFGFLWLWFVPEFIADKIFGSFVSRILNNVGGESQPTRTFVPLVLPFLAYGFGIWALVFGCWKYFS